ncbi:MAG: hypothetical protein LBB36_02755, partial [Fibromonadaceae bacterium]|nr:hypothetical protein [Fibromonadaceae bacterium]
MKRGVIALFLFMIFSYNVFAEDMENAEGKYETKYYDLSGFALELSYFNLDRLNFLNIGMGLGYNWGELKTMYSHYGAKEYGIYMEYKAIKELHSGIYYDLSGGSGAMLLGASGIMITDFEKATVGVAPRIGLGVIIKLFYRYNFCVNKKFNSHEIVLS